MDRSVLEKLINAHGISGRETEVRKLIRSEIKKYVDTVKVDKMGNLIAHKKGKGQGQSVMLAAHMDEVGLLVSEIRGSAEGKAENGKIRILPVGSVEPVAILGERVMLGSNVVGVVTTKAMSEGAAVEEMPTMEELYVDTGLTKKELKKKGVEVGTYVTFEQCQFCTLGSSNDVSGKAIDDRIGCFMLIELAKRLKRTKNDIYYVFTVQEEVGPYGAKTSAYKVAPDWAVVVDVTDADGRSIRVGDGPYINIMDAEMIGNPCIDDWLKKIAKRHKIPLQFSVSSFGTTDALSIAFSREGVPTAVMGVPAKNLHSSIGMANLKDVRNGIRLLELLLKNPPEICVQ